MCNEYCMVPTVAFQFRNLSRENDTDARYRYLTFADKAGTATLAELVQSTGLKVPDRQGCIKEIGESISSWAGAARIDRVICRLKSL